MLDALYETKLVTKTYLVSFPGNNLCLCIKHVWANLNFERTAMIIKYDKFFTNMENTQNYYYSSSHLGLSLYYYYKVCL